MLRANGQEAGTPGGQPAGLVDNGEGQLIVRRPGLIQRRSRFFLLALNLREQLVFFEPHEHALTKNSCPASHQQHHQQHGQYHTNADGDTDVSAQQPVRGWLDN